MTTTDEAAVITWTVLVNGEDQYGLFPANQPVPPGWEAAGYAGTEDECITFVDQCWTDLRPASLRRAMATREQP